MKISPERQIANENICFSLSFSEQWEKKPIKLPLRFQDQLELSKHLVLNAYNYVVKEKISKAKFL